MPPDTFKRFKTVTFPSGATQVDAPLLYKQNHGRARASQAVTDGGRPHTLPAPSPSLASTACMHARDDIARRVAAMPPRARAKVTVASGPPPPKQCAGMVVHGEGVVTARAE